MNLSEITQTLMTEIKLTKVQAKIFLHIVIHGKMNTTQISKELDISDKILKLVNEKIKEIK